MGRIKSILAGFMSIVLMIGLIANINIVNARAEGEGTQQVTFTLSIGMDEGSQAPSNYGISYTLMENDTTPAYNGARGVINGNSDGSVNFQQVTIDVPASYKIRIEVSSAGNDIIMGDDVVTTDWSGGKLYTVSDIQGMHISALLRNKSNSPGPGGQEQGGQGEGPGGQGQESGGNWIDLPDGEKLTVSFNGSISGLNVAGNEIDIHNSSSPVKITRIKKESNGNISIAVFSDPTIIFSSLVVNGKEYVKEGDSKEQYTIEFPDTTRDIDINAVTTSNDNDFTIVWTYKLDPNLGPECLVEHGKVEMVSGYKSGNDSYYIVEKDSTVTVKLIPDYGYQVVGARLNGDVDLSPDNNNTSQFTFTMPATQIHFQGVFKETEDLIENNVSSVVSKTSFTGKDIASTGGTAKMTLGSAKASDTSAVSKEIDTNKTIQAVDIKMEQLFYKNTSSDMWTTQKTDLASEATVTLTVTGDASVGYAVLREHNGTVEEIPANYNPDTNTITFKSAKYSTYTLVPLKETNNTLQDVKPEDTQNNNSKSEAATTVEIPSIEIVEAEEVARPVQTISIDKSQVSLEANKELSGKTYNLSSYITAKGFTTAIEKIVKSNPNEKRISIYTSKPICFTKTMVSNITKTKADVVYYFMHKGHLYSVTIPANTDIQKIFGKTSFQGPLYIGKVLGTSRLIK